MLGAGKQRCHLRIFPENKRKTRGWRRVGGGTTKTIPTKEKFIVCLNQKE
jgi:hypothetical protein